VSLHVPRDGASQGSRYDRRLEGTGETPEAAYRDLLKGTALELAEDGV